MECLLTKGLFVLPTFANDELITTADDGESYYYETLLRKFVWQDGAPCGVIEE